MSFFQIEMSEVRSIITGATSRSLVLVDEICRGTETAKGTCIAGSIIETLDTIGCLGIVSTHLHGIFDLPLTTHNTVYKAMETEYTDGQPRPTWKLTDGICKESLAFETAQREGVPETIIKRAEELYLSAYSKDSSKRQKDVEVESFTSDIEFSSFDKAYDQRSSIRKNPTHPAIASANLMEIFQRKIESVVTNICKRSLLELNKKNNMTELAAVKCVLISARQQPPPSAIGASSVYILLRPDKRIYVGQVLNISVYLCSFLHVSSKCN